MRDVELYQQLLEVVSPWTVNRVELSVEGERVDDWVRAKEKRVPTRLGVDEKAISKWARYVIAVCDVDASTVEYVAEDRRMESLDGSRRARTSELARVLDAVAGCARYRASDAGRAYDRMPNGCRLVARRRKGS
jgi:hypothetical protein